MKVQSSKSRQSRGRPTKSAFKIQNLRADFPILNKKGRKMIYLDSASTSLKPKQVIQAVTDFYENYTANVHRGIYKESEEATQKYEAVRDKVAKLINADREEIIFTKNTTESINLVAKTWKKLGKIMVSIMEHHSNFLPWQQLVRSKIKDKQSLRSKDLQRSKLIVLDINGDGELDLSNLDQQLKGVALVAITHVSNVLGTINPVAEIIKKAHQAGALVLIDGAQAVGHFKVDVRKLGCDFYVFSGHKCLGPSGVGVLWMRKEIAQSLQPFLTGGGMVSKVTLEEVSFLDVPQKFEAGTPNIEGVIGLGAAIEYLNGLGINKIRQHEKVLTKYALKRLSEIEGLTIYGPKKRSGIIAFNIAGIHPHDLASMLDQEGIAVRAGHHCALPLHQRLGIKASARISFHVYNTLEDIDRLVESLESIKHKLSS